MQKARQSRRSACDRCRNYKLRCERVPDRGNECQRCLKSDIPCRTTEEEPEHSSDVDVSSSDSTSIFSFHTEDGTGVSSWDSHAMGVDCFGDPGHIEYSMPDLAITSNPAPTSSGLFHRPAQNRQHSISLDFGQITEPYSLTPTSQEPSPTAFDASPKILSDIFQLCAHISNGLNDSNIGDQSFINREIQDVLSWTTQLTEIIGRLTTSIPHTRPPSLSVHGSDQIQSAGAMPRFTNSITHSTYGSAIEAGSSTRLPDTVLTTTLIAGYILLRRAWRRVFCQLLTFMGNNGQHDLFESLSLPGLQLGGIHVQTNSNIQLRVLIELCITTLPQIEGSLGISSSEMSQQPGGCTGRKVPTVKMDPVSVSLRETLLSQDVLRAASANEPSLLAVVGEMKDRLQNRP